MLSCIISQTKTRSNLSLHVARKSAPNQINQSEYDIAEKINHLTV